VVVNDLGGSLNGSGHGSAAANVVVEDIRATGGVAIADSHDVVCGDRIIETAIDAYGRVDIVICNAGILRDRSFKNMSDEEWRQVVDVHLLGSYKTARAAWRYMQERQYGRLVLTSSAAGLYGNFGQANYSAAKLGIYGLTRTLAVEGASKNIRANCIAPLAASRMAGTVFSEDMMRKLRPDAVSPLVAYLCHESCTESGSMFEVGGGWIAKLRWERAAGAAFNPLSGHSIEDVAAHWERITSFSESDHPNDVESCFTPFARNLGIRMEVSSQARGTSRSHNEERG
jgi:3-hydroxyacyl-CoA dehydrogenase/3a,7a,12a-trihydroxy-5b-cholest-24-enoyl-CoA hydratase